MIKFVKTNDQTYSATDGVNTVSVAYGWLRGGGWQWIVQDERLTQLWITGTSRRAAAEKALRKLAVA